MEAQRLPKHLNAYGYGITLSKVDKVTESGQPDLMIDSITGLRCRRNRSEKDPKIYFWGTNEKLHYHKYQGTKRAFYPSGDQNVFSTYEGDAGIELNLMNRALFAIREQSLKSWFLTISQAIPKILIYRNIRERVQKISAVS